jgi:hypothetical protein
MQSAESQLMFPGNISPPFSGRKISAAPHKQSSVTCLVLLGLILVPDDGGGNVPSKH